MPDEARFEVVFHHEEIFDIKHGADDQKGKNRSKTKTREERSTDKGIRLTTEGKEKGKKHEQENRKEWTSTDRGEDPSRDIDLHDSCKETTKDQVTPHIEKLINSLYKDLKDLSSRTQV